MSSFNTEYVLTDCETLEPVVVGDLVTNKQGVSFKVVELYPTQNLIRVESLDRKAIWPRSKLILSSCWRTATFGLEYSEA